MAEKQVGNIKFIWQRRYFQPITEYFPQQTRRFSKYSQNKTAVIVSYSSKYPITLYSLLLRHTELIIVALLRHKFIVRAGFCNALIADEHYLVAVLDC